MHPPVETIFEPLFVVGLFLGLWGGLSLAIAALGGWRRIASSYCASSEPVGRRYFMQQCNVGFIRYGNYTTIHTSPEGIHVAVLFVYRPGHRPLFIPWDAIRHAKVVRGFGIVRVQFEIGSPRIASMKLPRKIFEGYESLIGLEPPERDSTS
jgi:hypothetical protein